MTRSRQSILLASFITLAFTAHDVHAQDSSSNTAIPTKAEVLVALNEAANQWDAGCAKTDRHGFCVSRKRVKDAKRCGGGYDRVTVKRKAKTAKRARVALHKALASFRAAPQKVQQGTQLNAAAVQMRLAAAAAERLLARPFPTRLNFDLKNDKELKASLKRFKRWLNQAQTAFKEAQEGYVATAKLAGSDPLAIEARKRAAAITVVFAEMLEHAYIPTDVRSPPYENDKKQAYCDELGQTGRPAPGYGSGDGHALVNLARSHGNPCETSKRGVEMLPPSHHDK